MRRNSHFFPTLNDNEKQPFPKPVFDGGFFEMPQASAGSPKARKESGAMTAYDKVNIFEGLVLRSGARQVAGVLLSGSDLSPR
jgi:hypothetical protein